MLEEHEEATTSRPIDIHPDAAREANEAVDYYELMQEGLGDDFRKDMKAALDRIQQNPRLYGVESGDSSSLPTSPVSLQRLLRRSDHRIWVAAIGHQRRRPGIGRDASRAEIYTPRK